MKVKSKKIKLLIRDKYAKVPISYSRRNGCSFPVYQPVFLSLRVKERNLFSFLPQCLCIVFKSSYYIDKIKIQIGTKKNEISGIRASDQWQEISFDVARYALLLHNALRTNINILRLVILPFSPARAAQFHIKEIYLRPYTAGEIEKNERRIIYRKRRKLPSINLYKYLNHNFHSCAITQIDVRGDDLEVKGTIPVDTPVYSLCEIPVFSEFSVSEFGEKIEICPDASGNFSTCIPRFTDKYGALYDRLYSRWAVVIKTDSGYSLASHARYADHAVSAGELPVITPRSRKGLGDFRTNAFESDLDDLTISYITINIRMNDFLCNKQEKQEGVIPFEYNGKEYYADRMKISKYDAIMRSARQRNIIVSAIILVYPEHSSKDRAIGRILEHPEYETSGAYSMPNMTTPESLNLYAAGIDFLASRYSRSDALFGHIHRWIVHNEIDAGAVWTSAGRKDIFSYMDIYMKSLRLVYLTALKYNKNAEVFVPFTHFWKDRFNDECYAPSDMLEILLLYSRKEGDFRWGIACHAYPADLIEPKSWLDKNVTSDFQTPLITFKNLEVLDEWAKQPDTFYQNREPRRVMLSEQNPNSRDYSERELNEQAACLAYAWKKMQACSHIEAYIAHSWIDAHFEGGLKTGLRKYPDDPSDPSGRKPAWYVFSSLGTDREDGACEFAKKIIGINEWKEIYNGENREENGLESDFK